MLLRSAPPAGTDAVLQLGERVRRVMTARCVPEGSHGCDNSALWDTRFFFE